MSKWHVREIKKGVYGELSKVQEELDEAVDAEEQGQTLMLLYELSDIIGAVGGIAKKYGMTLDQIYKFCQLRTKVIEQEIYEKGLLKTEEKMVELTKKYTEEPSRIISFARKGKYDPDGL